MALLSLLFDRPKKLEIRARDNLEAFASNSERQLMLIDAANDIVHQNEAQPTDNPVEEGVDISDHVDIKPKVVSFSGVVSEAPISIEQALVGNVAGAVGAVASGPLGSFAGAAITTGVSILGGLLLNQSSGEQRVLEALNAFLEIQEKKIPVTIQAGLRAYNSMILSSFTPTENASNGRSLVFTATFREIRIVKSLEAQDRTFAEAIAPSAASTQSQGKKVANEANDQVSARGSSFLSDITGLGA